MTECCSSVKQSIPKEAEAQEQANCCTPQKPGKKQVKTREEKHDCGCGC